MVTRKNSTIDMLNTGKALLDMGAGVAVEIPIDGAFQGLPGPQGPPGPYTPAINMSSAQDLNTYVTTGNWNAQSNAVASGGANYPVPAAGLLSVIARSDGVSVVQNYRTYGTRITYTRSLYAGTWSTWEKLALDFDQAPVTPRDKAFGAKGDGVTDDTAALQAWLNSANKTKVLGYGTFRITANLTASVAGSTITGPGTIKVDTAGVDALNITAADVTVSGVEIDGNTKARYLVYSTAPRTVVERCNLHDAYSTTTSPRGVYLWTGGGGTVRHNRIWNIHSVGNASLGDGNGMSRGVVFYSTTDVTAAFLCHDNWIDNIHGEEGDGISVIMSAEIAGGSYPRNGKVDIHHNTISNVSRRFIKIQGSGIRVADNVLRHDGAIPAHPSSAIDVIWSNDITITGNEINPHPLSASVAINGESAGTPARNVVVEGNIIRQVDANASSAIYCKWVDGGIITNNTVHGGSNAVLLGSCQKTVIIGNTHFGGDPAAVSFSANSSNSDITMRYNINANPARTTATLNSGPGALSNDWVRQGEIVVNVRDFGAKGDNATNDTAAIQAAINSLPNSSGYGGGTVLFDHGTFLVSGTINIPMHGVHLRSTGSFTSSIKPFGAAQTGPLFKFSVPNQYYRGARITDLRFNMRHAPATAFRMESAYDNSMLENIYIYDVGGSANGIEFVPNATVVTEGTVVGQTIACINVWVSGSAAAGTIHTGNCWYLENVQEAVFTGCKGLSGSETSGTAWYIKGSRGLHFSGVSAAKASKGFTFDSSVRTISGVTIDGPTLEGLTQTITAVGTFLASNVEFRNPRAQFMETVSAGPLNLDYFSASTFHTRALTVIVGATSNQVQVVTGDISKVTDDGVDTTIIQWKNVAKQYTIYPALNVEGKASPSFRISVTGRSGYFQWIWSATSSTDNGMVERYNDGSANRNLRAIDAGGVRQRFYVYNGSAAVESWQITNSPTAGKTAVLLLNNTAESGLRLQQVEVGAIDSGGSGFRMLRVAN